LTVLSIEPKNYTSQGTFNYSHQELQGINGGSIFPFAIAKTLEYLCWFHLRSNRKVTGNYSFSEKFF